VNQKKKRIKEILETVGSGLNLELIKNKIKEVYKTDNVYINNTVLLCLDDFALYIFYIIMVDTVKHEQPNINLNMESGHTLTEDQIKEIKIKINEIDATFIDLHHKVYSGYQNKEKSINTN
jgi:hypothetical protein